MIRLHEGEVKFRNATVVHGEDEHAAFVERDAEGHLDVTVEAELEVEKSVTLINNKENDATYSGKVLSQDDQLFLA